MTLDAIVILRLKFQTLIWGWFTPQQHSGDNDKKFIDFSRFKVSLLLSMLFVDV
jgi:hypothetical protein